MSDDRLQVAIDIVARHLIARAVEESAGSDWDLVPEVGEHDWTAISDRMVELAPWPPAEQFDAAYEYLEGRASNDG